MSVLNFFFHLVTFLLNPYVQDNVSNEFKELYRKKGLVEGIVCQKEPEDR